MCKHRFTVIGISDSRNPNLPPEALEAVAAGRVFSGGKRHRDIVGRLLPADAKWIDITVPLERVFEQYRAYDEIIVFASGDPLFFGFAATLRRVFPDAEMRVLPAPYSLQMLAREIAIPYQDMVNVSVTGRPYDALDAALIEGRPLIGVLTDRRHTPGAIARRMLDFGYSNYEMSIGENLGHEELQRVKTLSLGEAASFEAGMPNCLILRRTEQRRRPLGIPENEFELLDGRVRMITKMPVRLLSLSMLDLRHRHTLWDIGFCTGSVSVEAKLQFPHLKVAAFEVREEGRRLMEVNAARFGTPGIEVHIGDFLDCDLKEIAPPDAVFIGGHGGKLAEMMRRLRDVANPGCVIVFNSVSADSLALFEKSAAECGFRISQRHTISVDDFNPITILKAE